MSNPGNWAKVRGATFVARGGEVENKPERVDGRAVADVKREKRLTEKQRSPGRILGRV